MNRQVPWLRVLVEGVVIVLSILLAFGIDAWWDRQIDRREETESLDALRSDFLGTVEELNRTAVLHRGRLAAASTLLSTPEAALRALGPDSLGYLVSRSGWRTTIDPPVATLSGLIASGQLSLISDKLLRAKLAQWNGLLDDHEAAQELLVTVLTNQYSPWLRSRVLMEEDDLRSVRVEPNFDPLFEDFGFDNQLILIVGGTGRLLAELEHLTASAEEIVEMLERAR